MILADNAELALPAIAELADHLIDILTPPAAYVTLPALLVTQLQSEVADLKKLALELHAVQRQSCSSSGVPGRRSEKPRATIHLYLP